LLTAPPLAIHKTGDLSPQAGEPYS
jgi:hypothetical protein